EFADGVQDRMDDVASQLRRIPHTERPGADRVDTPFVALPEEVVLAAEEDADDGPHVMVMRLQGHPRCPREIEDRQVGSAMERPNARLRGLAQHRRHRCRLGKRFGHEPPPRAWTVRSRNSGATTLDEAAELEHDRRISRGAVASPGRVGHFWPW